MPLDDLVAEESFSYRATKQGSVFIYWHTRQVMIVKGGAARSLLARLASASPTEAQLILAKITGNFKRGNERR